MAYEGGNIDPSPPPTSHPFPLLPSPSPPLSPSPPSISISLYLFLFLSLSLSPSLSLSLFSLSPPPLLSPLSLSHFLSRPLPPIHSTHFFLSFFSFSSSLFRTRPIILYIPFSYPTTYPFPWLSVTSSPLPLGWVLKCIYAVAFKNISVKI
jgi:hypothetical protein